NEQLKIKQRILEQSFKRYTGIEDVKVKVSKTLNDGMDTGYSEYHEWLLRNTNFGLAMGYFKPMTNHFVYVENCLVQHKEVNQIAQLALKLFRKYRLKAHDLRNKEGILFNTIVRYFKDTDQASVVMIVKENHPKLEIIAEEMIDTFQSIQSVGYTIYNPDSHKLMYHPVVLLAGHHKIKTHYHGLPLSISPDGSYPNHINVFERMDDLIVKETGLSDDDVVLNLYENATISSIFFAQYAKKVYAIDYKDKAIKDALENINQLQIPNIEVVEDHVEGVLPTILKQDKEISMVILNAPKHGLSKTTIDLLNKYKLEQVIYISENPSTLAKDMAALMTVYRVRNIVPVDLYPQTARIDSITILDRL
ncbi:MAG TPA: hypothetical protein VJ878_04060, partial [Candidatus Izemoplasmatales bacterium]|nr:hypothetical protein [Candidatus Izemoplasmatales bacterium]